VQNFQASEVAAQMMHRIQLMTLLGAIVLMTGFIQAKESAAGRYAQPDACPK
jgi:hypothetical protein